MGNTCNCVAVEPSESADSGVQDADDYIKPRRPSRSDVIDNIDEVYQLDVGRSGVLGSSSIGTIVSTLHRKSQTMRAVKQICKRSIEGDGWKDELQTIQQLDHPHICKLHETWEDSRNVYLVMELCKGGQLTNLPRRHEKLNEGMIAALVWQMADAVGHLHEHNIVHSDIKPENWLFAELSEDAPVDTNLKMIDFGLANKHGKHNTVRRRSFRGLRSEAGDRAVSSRSNGSKQHSYVNGSGQKRLNIRDQQSLFCKSPEQLDEVENGHGTSITLDLRQEAAKSDVWALGVLAYFLLSGQSPFHGSAETKDVQIRNARFVFMPADLWRPVSAEAKNFIALCLQRDPAARPSAAKALGLPWMRQARGVIEECISLGKSPLRNGTLSAMDPPLPSGESILSSFDQMNQLNQLEKAGVIAAAHHLSFGGLADLSKVFDSLDRQREGLLSLTEVFEALLSFGVPCSDLLKQVRELDNEGNVAVEYSEFISAVHDFQRNMQESAVWAVFRSFDTHDGSDEVRKKDLCKVLGQGNLRKCLAETFPGLLLERVVQDMDKDGNATIDFDQFTQVLRNTAPALANYNYLQN